MARHMLPMRPFEGNGWLVTRGCQVSKIAGVTALDSGERVKLVMDKSEKLLKESGGLPRGKVGSVFEISGMSSICGRRSSEEGAGKFLGS